MAHVDIRPEDIEAVSKVLASGSLRQGKVVAEFEEAFAARVGAAHAVAVSSGTAALHLAYMGIFKPGDEVIVPSFTFVATASMLLAVGAVPVFVDIDPDTFCLSPADVQPNITEKTRGIAGVHLFGNACDVDGLVNLAREHGLSLVWDAAQALGTEWNGQDVGTYPDAVCYSFYPTKNITSGEGGMIVTGDPDLAKLLRLTRSQGAEGKYRHTVLGFNYRMTDFQASLGLCQLRRLDEYISRRRQNAEELSNVLKDIDGLSVPVTTSGALHTYNQYAVRVSSVRSRRDDVATALEMQGIQSAVHYPRALHQQPMFGHLPPSKLNESEFLCEEILCLPVHPGVSTSTARRVGLALSTILTDGLGSDAGP